VGSSLPVLPLAVVMVAGPQIISAFILATGMGARRNSTAYLGGVLLATVLATTFFFFLTDELNAGDQPRGGGSNALDYITIGLLVILGIYVYLRRDVSEPPKWMGRLQRASPGFSFRLGFLLFLFMPTDVVTTFTVGSTIARENDSLLSAIPFWILTGLLVAIPLLILLLLGRRAEVLLPKIRAWIDSHSWLVSEFVILIFLVITISGM
jgi:threonine/homoserine/homoserine lactone efflux protein